MTGIHTALWAGRLGYQLYRNPGSMSSLFRGGNNVQVPPQVVPNLPAINFFNGASDIGNPQGGF